MKRLFNLLLSFLLALGFNIDTTWRDNTQTYNPETFYHAPTEGHTVSTRSYENGKYETNSALCTASTKKIDAAIPIATDTYTTYWIGVNTPQNLEVSTLKIITGDILVAPFDCKVVQIDTGTPNGITAYFGFTIDYKTYYILELENLDRVYCCRNRGTTPTAGWLGHSVDVTGNQLSAGDMLGIANENTVASLYESSSDYVIVQSVGAEVSRKGVAFGDALK